MGLLKKLSLFLIALLAVAAATDKKLNPGTPAPAFKLPLLDGDDSIALSDYRGKVVLIDFWASWCAPCKKSLPYMQDLDRRFKDLHLITVNIDDEKENARRFLKEMGVSLTVVHDAQKEVVNAYNIPAMPTAVLVDQYGKIQYVHTGYNEESVRKLEFAVRGLVDMR